MQSTDKCTVKSGMTYNACLSVNTTDIRRQTHVVEQIP